MNAGPEPQLAIVWHSRTGASEQLAGAAIVPVSARVVSEDDFATVPTFEFSLLRPIPKR